MNGNHTFYLDDETYFALLRLTEQRNRDGKSFLLADDMLKEMVLERDRTLAPDKSTLEKIWGGEPLDWEKM